MTEQVGFKQLRAWQKSDDLAAAMVRVARSLPHDCRPLPSQIIGAAISVPANIAEGYARASLREYLRHLSIARASHAETLSYIHLINRLELITRERHSELAELSIEVGSILYGLMRSLAKKVETDGARRGYAISDTADVDYGAHSSPLTPNPSPLTLDS